MAIDISPYCCSKLLPPQVANLTSNCFLDPNWLAIFEEFSGLKMIPHHQVISSHGSVIGFLPGYIQEENLCGTLGDRLLGRISGLPYLRSWTGEKAFVCDAPWGFYSGIECNRNDESSVYQALIRSIDSIAETERLAMSGFTYVPESSRELVGQLEVNGYKRFPNIPTTFIDLKWKSFEEYVSQLSSGKTRRKIRLERKRSTGVSFHWFEEERLDVQFSGRPLFVILMDLYNQTLGKHKKKASPLNNRFLLELWDKDRSNLMLNLAFLEGRIVAFALLRIFNGIAHVFMVGRTYDIDDKLSPYFNLAYNETIIRGIKEGWRGIYFRPGVFRVKLTRGCRIEKLNLYVKGHNAFAKRIIDILLPIKWNLYDRYIHPRLLEY
jgi:predicted N-acyltransferase